MLKMTPICFKKLILNCSRNGLKSEFKVNCINVCIKAFRPNFEETSISSVSQFVCQILRGNGMT